MDPNGSFTMRTAPVAVCIYATNKVREFGDGNALDVNQRAGASDLAGWGGSFLSPQPLSLVLEGPTATSLDRPCPRATFEDRFVRRLTTRQDDFYQDKRVFRPSHRFGDSQLIR